MSRVIEVTGPDRGPDGNPEWTVSEVVIDDDTGDEWPVTWEYVSSRRDADERAHAWADSKGLEVVNI